MKAKDEYVAGFSGKLNAAFLKDVDQLAVSLDLENSNRRLSEGQQLIKDIREGRLVPTKPRE